jgi:hypothetical protein
MHQVSSHAAPPPFRNRFDTLRGAKMAAARRFYPPGSVIVGSIEADTFVVFHRDEPSPFKRLPAWLLSPDWEWVPLAPHPPANGLK